MIRKPLMLRKLHSLTNRFDRSRCSRFRIERSQVAPYIAHSGARDPFSLSFVPIDSRRARRASARGAIPHVLTLTDGSQVCPSIVEFAPVDVVANRAIMPCESWQAQNLTVHVDVSPSAVKSDRADGIPFTETPLPLIDEIGVSGINQGVRSNAAIFGAERDTHSILRLHRVPPVPVATPPAVSSSAGVSCVNFTIPGGVT